MSKGQQEDSLMDLISGYGKETENVEAKEVKEEAVNSRKGKGGQ